MDTVDILDCCKTHSNLTLVFPVGHLEMIIATVFLMRNSPKLFTINAYLYSLLFTLYLNHLWVIFPVVDSNYPHQLVKLRTIIVYPITNNQCFKVTTKPYGINAHTHHTCTPDGIIMASHRMFSQPISSKTVQLPNKPVKDGQPVSCKKLILSNSKVSYSNRAVKDQKKREKKIEQKRII